MSYETMIFNFENNRYEKFGEFQGILFHHIPKTAGSTFRGILENMFLEEEICRAETPEEIEAITQEETQRYKLFAGHFSYQVCDDIIKDRVWITFLRNPIDRVVSYYYNLIDPKRMPNTWQLRFEARHDWSQFLAFIRHATFKEFIYSNNKKANKIVCNRQTQAFISDDIRTKVEDWGIYDESLISIAKQNLKEKFAFVGIQEYFDLSLDLFSATFALNPIDATNYTTNLNTKKCRDTKYDLDEEVLAIVKEKNQMDLELYAYAKELFFERLHQINTTMLWHNRMQTVQSTIDTEPTIKHRFNIEEVYGTHGFYTLEKAYQKSFKWSGYQNPSILEFIFSFQAKRSYRLEIALVNIIDEAILSSVKIVLNDSVLAHKFQKKWMGRKYSAIVCEISSDAGEPGNMLHALQIFSDLKKEGTHEGARSIGLAISGIEIKEK